MAPSHERRAFYGVFYDLSQKVAFQIQVLQAFVDQHDYLLTIFRVGAQKSILIIVL